MSDKRTPGVQNGVQEVGWYRITLEDAKPDARGNQMFIVDWWDAKNRRFRAQVFRTGRRELEQRWQAWSDREKDGVTQ